MRNDIVKSIKFKSAEKLVQVCIEYGLDVYTIEGTLLDSYLIDNSHESFNFGKSTIKYVLITSNYVNCWQAELQIRFTDDKKYFDEFVEQWKNENEEVFI
ncbi:hypothetical protein [Staphylococcus pseudintermedius]|uniref:hypothetical protein n=1 Tax=Staphylococcus pseudintermedius TaxID=283734 RepID=UPI001BDE9ADF|nr:hypothetical protein [Staphylococcus pseudintermedius]EIK0255519.1 hypothetical protein [Staphylococcus pseudintermedius]MCE5702172.1 hypothetical protein [Staphylococcus pseudintermedius]HAR6088293.1 hypothetical protein [Staphylococcus pseudintermedius]